MKTRTDLDLQRLLFVKLDKRTKDSAETTIVSAPFDPTAKAFVQSEYDQAKRRSALFAALACFSIGGGAVVATAIWLLKDTAIGVWVGRIF
jgi:hypothetical protein